MTAGRVVEVAPDRYPAWVERFEEGNRGLEQPQQILEVDSFEHDPVGVVLVRRGGYAVAQVEGGQVVTSKVGAAYVQSQTKKGGWSQQRYARRRGKQANELVGRVRGHAARVLDVGGVDGVVLGGDRALVREVLDDARLAPLRRLPTRELYDLPDPRRDVLEQAVRRALAVRVTILDP